MHALRRLAIICLALIPCVIAHGDDSDRARLFYDGFFEKHISAYNLFADPLSQTPNAGLLPYDINIPLFTDYAQKDRFLYLPPGTHVAYRDTKAFEFPVGAALIKTFSYPADFRRPKKNRRLVETRLLIHTPDGWKGAAYLWNDAQTDADLKIAGATVPMNWIGADGTTMKTDYLVPNMNQCKACHRGTTGITGPLGPNARQLNRTYDYSSGSANQLDHWTRSGILSDAPPSKHAPRLPRWDDPRDGTLVDRARGYLDINCAHCHNPVGLASYTRLDLTYRQDNPHNRGIMKRPTAAGNSSRGRYFAIVPGDPDASFLLSRLNATAPHIRMPQIGRTVVHDEGVALLREWILSLKPE
jgi:uncharacterized repeat protein (TIGR03806 family)